MKLLDEFDIYKSGRVCAQGGLKRQSPIFPLPINLTIDKVLPRIQIGPQLCIKLIILEHAINKLKPISLCQDYSRSTRTSPTRLMKLDHVTILLLDIKHVNFSVFTIGGQGLNFVHGFRFHETDGNLLEVLAEVFVRYDEDAIA